MLFKYTLSMVNLPSILLPPLTLSWSCETFHISYSAYLLSHHMCFIILSLPTPPCRGFFLDILQLKCKILKVWRQDLYRRENIMAFAFLNLECPNQYNAFRSNSLSWNFHSFIFQWLNKILLCTYTMLLSFIHLLVTTRLNLFPNYCE